MNYQIYIVDKILNINYLKFILDILLTFKEF